MKKEIFFKVLLLILVGLVYSCSSTKINPFDINDPSYNFLENHDVRPMVLSGDISDIYYLTVVDSSGFFDQTEYLTFSSFKYDLNKEVLQNSYFIFNHGGKVFYHTQKNGKNHPSIYPVFPSGEFNVKDKIKEDFARVGFYLKQNENKLVLQMNRNGKKKPYYLIGELSSNKDTLEIKAIDIPKKYVPYDSPEKRRNKSYRRVNTEDLFIDPLIFLRLKADKLSYPHDSVFFVGWD